MWLPLFGDWLILHKRWGKELHQKVECVKIYEWTSLCKFYLACFVWSGMCSSSQALMGIAQNLLTKGQALNKKVIQYPPVFPFPNSNTEVEWSLWWGQGGEESPYKAIWVLGMLSFSLVSWVVQFTCCVIVLKRSVETRDPSAFCPVSVNKNWRKHSSSDQTALCGPRKVANSTSWEF